MIKLCDKRISLINSNGHLMVKGGPGSGKTTISLYKAQRLVESEILQKGQKILFLSFARSTVSRVMESAKEIVSKEVLSCLEVNTYHSFAWSIIQCYGKLLVKNKVITLISPPDASSLFFGLNKDDRRKKSLSLFYEEGILAFDLFAELAVEILRRSNTICNILSDGYPYIFVDEFQDTDVHEWELIKLLGTKSSIIALADPYQRIYDFRGASPKRISDYNSHFSPTEFDFGKENNRSGGTDIADFGNDLLTGANIGKTYKHVVKNRYAFDGAEPMSSIKYNLLASLKRIKKVKPNGHWSIAILVRTKANTLAVSSYLSKSSKRLSEFNHEVLIDPAGPALAAVLIASLLEQQSKAECLDAFVVNIIAHLRGRKNSITKADLTFSEVLTSYRKGANIRGKNRQFLISEIERVVEQLGNLEFEGIPERDWIKTRNLIEKCEHEVLKNIFLDAKYIRLLNRGAILSEKLAQSWRDNANYANSRNAVKDALVQEHFSMSTRNYSGIFVMTMHKSKGKEFDEVIIWEDKYQSIVPFQANAGAIEQARYLLRVAVTRAKSYTTINTPAASPCILL
jgi:DNA helicase-2/ATP-dependent DNA helicase PcrA